MRTVKQQFHGDRLQKADGSRPLEAFKPLPRRMTVRVQVLPEKDQRYETVGDWFWTRAGLDIRLSREFVELDPRYGLLLLIHELLEAMLCRGSGIPTAAVDAFDMAFAGDGEPGDDPSAPYYLQHRVAETVERTLAGKLGVKFRQYLGDM